MNEFDALNITDSEDDEGAGERVKSMMEEIIRNQDKIKSEKDIDEMADRCTSMLMQMRNEASTKKKEKKTHRATGSGDKASPPPSRLLGVKESPKKDSTKPSASPQMPTQSKSSLKNTVKNKPRPNFAEMYKEKMEKLRAHGKMDLTESKTKSDSAKPLKSRVGISDNHRKKDKIVEEVSSETESDSSSEISDSESQESDVMESRTYQQILKEMQARDTVKGGKESEAHKKTAEWMSSTRGDQTKKKEESIELSSKGARKTEKQAPKAQVYSTSSSSELEASDDEKLVQQLKAKLAKATKNNPPQNKEAMRKLMSAINENPTRAPVAKATIPPMRRPVAGSGTSKAASGRPVPASDKAKPKKKI